MKFSSLCLFAFLSCNSMGLAQARVGKAGDNDGQRRRQGSAENVGDVEVPSTDPGPDDLVQVIVGLKEPQEGEFHTMSDTLYSVNDIGVIQSSIPMFSVADVIVKNSLIEELASLPGVEFIEQVVEFHQDEETVPYGIINSFGGRRAPIYSSSLISGCDDENAIRVAIIDSGIDAQHYDFSFCGIDSKGKSMQGVPTKCKGEIFMAYTANDDEAWHNTRNSHGMHVAGTISASGMNNKYLTGMVGDEQICMLIARIFNDDGRGATTTAVLNAIQWAVESNARVINMSFGSSSRSQAIENAINQATAQGVLCIASSGNEAERGNPDNFPASFEATMSVAAVDENKNWAYFSSYNSMVNIAAPGTNILSTLPGNRVGTKSGTSMATPHVTGAAGFIWRECPECTRETVIECLLSTAEPLGWANGCNNNKCGDGFLRADLAYECMLSQECCKTVDNYTQPADGTDINPELTVGDEMTSGVELEPSAAPSQLPTMSTLPSSAPSTSRSPSIPPTESPSLKPFISLEPSFLPSSIPSGLPSPAPSGRPSFSPSLRPSKSPTVCQQKKGTCNRNTDCCSGSCKVKKNELSGECN